MPTNVYKTPPVTPEAHLGQLTALKEAADDDLSSIQKAVRNSLLHRTSLKALRTAQILEMAIAGFSNEQIKLAFAAPGSELLPLLEGFTGKDVNRFNIEIKAAQAQAKEIGPEESRELYIRSRARLLNTCWSFVGRVEPAQAKGMLEFMDKLMQDIAEASGVLKVRAGKRPNTRRAGRTVAPKEEDDDPAEKVEDTPVDVDPDWGGDFEADEQHPTHPVSAEE